MGWIIIIIIGYLPVFYRIHRRLSVLERELELLNSKEEI